ncbi:ShlB/FhaC/HecB family hemolysin secretion/activation protein [Campylobacter coli]|nr:ShlB/FhaC/HecB family hemolysin secretion/activation protein [Campylobacter coli]
MKFLKIIFLLMSFIYLLQADDSAKTLNLLDKRQQQLHIQKEFDELEKKQQQEKDVYLENQDSEDKIYIFKQIQFKKNDTLTMQANNILKKYINQPLSVNDIYNMIKERENVYVANYTLPIQSYQLSYSMQYSDNINMIEGYDNSFIKNTDTSLRHKIMLKKILHRTSKDKFSIYANLGIKDDVNEIDNFRLESSSGRYSSIASGVEYSTLAFGGFLFLNLEYEKGIPFLGSKKDSKDSLYKIEFNKVNFNLSYQKSFYANDGLAFLYQNSLGASYSNEPLLYADKFLIGDEYTVRGFKESSAALDYGAYSNNTIYLQFLNAPKYLRVLEPFVGLDMGYGRDYLLPNKDFLAGVAFGFRYNLNYLSLNLTASKALHKSSNMPSETIPIYLRASVFF